MPKLRVLAGPSAVELTDISHLVNTYQTHAIKSDRFEGLVCIHVKGFVGEDGEQRSSAYFEEAGSERKGVTWSIQVKGRFLKETRSDDVLFGNTFDRPLKLPWGSSAALKFMSFVDPTLEHALGSERPWALSPLISTMPYFALSKVDEKAVEHNPDALKEDNFACKNYIKDNVSDVPGVNLPKFNGPSARRSYFSSSAKRQQITYHPDDVITTDFCYGFLTFPEIRLNLPGGISFDLMRYWDGQPARFVCCERLPNGAKGPGDPFWCVAFEVVVDEEEHVEVPALEGVNHAENGAVKLEEQEDIDQTIDSSRVSLESTYRLIMSQSLLLD